MQLARLRPPPVFVAVSAVGVMLVAALAGLVLPSGSHGPGSGAPNTSSPPPTTAGDRSPTGVPGTGSAPHHAPRSGDNALPGSATPPGSSGVGTAAGSSVPNPAVTVSASTSGLRGRPYDRSVIDLAAVGYTEQEFFVSGTAAGYGGASVFGQSVSGLGPDGTSAPYTTRIVVRRPIDPSTFNGTVLFEWKNVTALVGLDLDWATGYREIVRDGFAWVGVDAQTVGVHLLQSWDPIRYGSLSHPGDQYAYDMFSQVVQAVRDPQGVDPLGGLGAVSAALADGHSQSGIYLHNYIDAVQNHANVIDGFLLRGDGNPVFDTGHLTVPVFQYMSETEVGGFTAFANRSGASPPADSENYHLWQIAGAAHQDNWENTYLEDQLARDWAGVNRSWDEQAAGHYGEEANPVGNCPYALSAGVGSPDATAVGNQDEFPQQYAVDAAIYYVNRWVRAGAAPPPAPRLETSAPRSVARDRYGNAIGGLRLPPVDVPVASYDGVNGCPLTGVSYPLSAATLVNLYPTHADYVAAMRAATARAVGAGYLLSFDAEDLMARAEAAPVPSAP